MSSSLVVDSVVIILMIAALWGGWRQGVFSSLLSTVGVIAGLVIGAAAAPFLITLTDSTTLRFILAVGIVVLLAGIGNIVGTHLGSSVRENIRNKSTLYVDSFCGAAFQGLATLIVAWLVSLPVAAAFPGSVAMGIGDSKILGFVDRTAPSGMDELPSKIAGLFSENGLPPLVSIFDDTSNKVVDAPNINIKDAELVNALRPSVIHVVGDAQECGRRLMGSGFVAADDYVVTNAHVVAGTSKVNLDTVTGTRAADVVLYDPNLDIAVLHSKHLGIKPLNWADNPLNTGDDAIVMGFPQSGPFEASPARIRERMRITGKNIYANGEFERGAYAIRGSVQSGNSGGPMLDPTGSVVGVVFGAAIDGSDTGYVLTAEEVRNRIGEIKELHDPVDTMSCVMS